MIKRIENIFSEITGLTDLNFTEKTRFDKGFDISSLAMIQHKQKMLQKTKSQKLTSF